MACFRHSFFLMLGGRPNAPAMDKSRTASRCRYLLRSCRLKLDGFKNIDHGNFTPVLKG
jgi:hypothetical protein